MAISSVELYIYDLSKGLAATLSPMIIGKKVDGVWHTSVVVYNREYFFGSHGVESCVPGGTALGSPLRVLKLGETQIPYSIFIDYLNGLSESNWAANTYNLFHHNCNNFSEEIVQFLCGASIPKFILDLPSEVINSALGSALPLLITQLEKSARPIAEEQQRSSRSGRSASPEFQQLNTEVDEARYSAFLLKERRKTAEEKLAKKERKKEKKRRKLVKQKSHPQRVQFDDDAIMADLEVNGNANNGDEEVVVIESQPQQQRPSAFEIEEEERREEEEKKKAREPPIVYKDVLDVKTEFDALLGLIDGKLNEEEMKSTEELQVYMIGNEGSWALSDGFLNFIGRLLHDKSLPVEVRVRTMNILAVAALKDDVILVLHQDRKDHVLMNYCYEIDRSTPEEQEAIALFIANMFENLNSSEWLMYISEWTYNNQQTSNIRVTTKVAVHSLLSDSTVLQDRGAAILHNLACKEVFDDVAVELTMALLQYFNSKPSEEQLFRCMKALAKFVQISHQEVPQLVQMIGPDPRTFKGTSERVDALIEQISVKLR